MSTLSERPLDGHTAVRELQAAVDAMAQQDAASGAWDLAAIESLATPFPRELEIEHLVDRTADEVRQAVAPVVAVDDTWPSQAPAKTHGHDPVIGAQLEVEDLRAAVAREQSRREHAGRVLRGEIDDHGTRWTGAEPSEPLSVGRLRMALRPERVQGFFVSTGLTLVALLIEWWIIKGTLQQQVRTDHVLEGLIYAAPAVLLVAAVPHVLGTILAKQLRRDRWERRAGFLFLVLVLFWIVPVGFLAHLRAQMAHDAEQSRSMTQQLLGGAETGEALTSTGMLVGQWVAILLGVGIALIAVKYRFYNPVAEQAMRSDAVLVVLHRRLRLAQARLIPLERARRETADQHAEAGRRREVARRSAAEAAAAQHREDTAFPLDLAVELRHRYRSALITAMASPELTTAIATVPMAPTVTAGPPAAPSLAQPSPRVVA